MNSFMSWVGGKRALRDEILRRFPLYYEKYIEVFGGAGWTLFHKPPGNDFEVYNDFNGLLVNLFRTVRDDPEGLKTHLQYILNAREEFEHARDALNLGLPATPTQKAAWFYIIIRFSYGSALASYDAQPHDLRADFPLIDQVSRRLAKVVVEHQSFEKLIPHFDSPVSFFYLDPPYHTTERYYKNVGRNGFTEESHILLRDILLSPETKGKFLLSYNDDPFVRELYDYPGIHIEPITRLNNIRQRYEPSCQFSELFISNYDTAERGKHLRHLAREPTQLTLFDQQEETNDEEELFYEMQSMP